MIERTKLFAAMLFVGWVLSALAAGEPPGRDTNVFVMQTIAANQRNLNFTRQEVNLGSHPENILFYFALETNASFVPVRIHYYLEGYDKDWQSDDGEMNLAITYYNDAGDQIGQKLFRVAGNSAGWNGSLKTSPLAHRRETVVVPPLASHVMAVISSAGPPDTTGIYTVANLAISKSTDGGPPASILQSPLDGGNPNDSPDQTPSGWVRDGTARSMAKIVEVGQEPGTKAFAILDDSLISHAEWHMDLLHCPRVSPGDRLVIEWNELFSIGVGNTRVAIYKNLPPGNFRFHVEALDIMGLPTGTPTTLSVIVPPPFWRTFWFWGIVFLLAAGLSASIGRYLTLRKIRLEMLRLEKKHLLEQERMRIAHDIHDDLGARVTQISLVSAMANANVVNLDQARANFDEISQMSRDLVAALYETVWAVNPENDNLSELGTYLFQMINKLCERAQCRCRFYIGELPSEISVPSQIRHNICLAVKESVHNVIRHAGASEITVRVALTGSLLTISIHDDGCGFESSNNAFFGHGLLNIKQRLKNIGGTSLINSQPGVGTTIQMNLDLKSIK